MSSATAGSDLSPPRDTRALEIVVFVAGAVLLSVEILASRLLAPYFGNSIYVWGSCIGTFLGALSVGYGVGGRLADRRPSTKVFATTVLVSGFLLLPIPVLSTAVLGTIARIDFGPRANPLIGSVLLFLLPSIVMGMVPPFAVRLRAHDVRTMGRTSGSLYAIGTAGSIAGTLLTSFVLIDWLGVRAIVNLMGLALLLSGMFVWRSARRGLVAAGGLGSFLLACVIGRSSAAASSTPYVRDTAYHRITVRDVGSVRYLDLDDYNQSAVDRREPGRAVFAYTDYLQVPLAFVSEPRRVTLIGLGGGTIASHWLGDRANVEMTAVELDPQVMIAARDWFELPASSRLRLVARDGRMHLSTSPEDIDVLLMDAYLVDTLPVHLATREFFALARSRLTRSGVLASNVIGALRGPKSRLFRALYRTISDVFRTVYVFPVHEGEHRAPVDARRNIIVVATDEARLPPDEIARRVAEVPRLAARSIVPYEERIDVDDVPVLTDDYAPVDALVGPR
jgi:spermidine synthase